MLGRYLSLCYIDQIEGLNLGRRGKRKKNGYVSMTLKCFGEGHVLAFHEIVDSKLGGHKRSRVCMERK